MRDSLLKWLVMKENKPICLIMTDSVALPRKYIGGIVKWNETYPSKLKAFLTDYEVVTVSIGGASITDLRNQVNYYKILNPKFVILQCGIVDAAPRAFGRIEMDFIKKMKLFRFTKPMVSFLRRYRAHHYTSPTNFERTLIEIKKELNAQEFYAVGILPISTEYERKLPGVKKYSQIYNNILKKHSSFISIDDIPPEGILKDHHHFNASGQHFIFNRILKSITRGN